MKNGNGDSRTVHPDVLVLRRIVRQLEQSVTAYNAVLAEVRTHKSNIANERAALRLLQNRIFDMRSQVGGWEKVIWDMGWRDSVPRDARERAERQIRGHVSFLDELCWHLLEFRNRSSDCQP